MKKIVRNLIIHFQVFQLYDINNDKKVSQDELTNAMKVILQVTDYQDSKG